MFLTDMKPLKIFLILLSVLFMGCRNHPLPVKNNWHIAGRLDYMNDPCVSDSMGNPRDSSSVYIPLNTVSDSTRYFYFKNPHTKRIEWRQIAYGQEKDQKEYTQERYELDDDAIKDSVMVSIDDARPKRVSEQLFSMQEPVLSNYYLGKTIYRLNISPTYSGNGVLTVIKEKDDSIRVVYHIAERRVHYLDPLKKEHFIEEDSFEVDKQFFYSMDSLIKAAGILTRSHWRKYGDFDGAEFLLELHRPEGYYYFCWGSLHNEGPPLDALINLCCNMDSLFKHKKRSK